MLNLDSKTEATAQPATGTSRGTPAAAQPNGDWSASTTPGGVEFVELALHDLQSAVALLDMSMCTLKETPADAPAVRDAQLATRRIQRYIDHMVTAERVSRGAYRMGRRPLALRPILLELVEEYAHHAREWGIHLELEFADSSDLFMLGDEVLLRRVLQNLIENALRHNRQGGRALVRASEVNGPEVRVFNDGTPIRGRARKQVFEKFVSQSDRGSAGVGLYFSRIATAAHGGSLEFEDHTEWPVCIALRLPAAETA
jgi:signal transduction histidine kinase